MQGVAGGLKHGASLNTLATPFGKESVMIKLGKVSVETRGIKDIYPEEIFNVPFTQL